MANDDVDKWIKEVEGKKFITLVIDMHAKIMDLLEYKRSKDHKVTMPLVANIKKAMDFLLKQCTEISEESKVMKTRLEDRDEYTKMLSDLAQKITRPSIDSVDEIPVKEKEIQQKRREEFSVIITPNTENQDMDVVKDKVKEICKGRSDLPTPNDVIVTKSNQVILKYRNKKEVEIMKDSLTEAQEIKNMAKVNVPVRRRDRVLILSVDPKLDEKEVGREVERLLRGMDTDISSGSFKERLLTAQLEGTTRSLIEGFLYKSDAEVRIIRKIQTKQGKNNWLLDVDADSKQALLGLRRICIDFERYRVVEFISITRCFKCQKFGHMANKCSEATHCVKCAGDHVLKDCKSETLCCANCYFNDAGGECSHRADSSGCPVFLSYRDGLLPNRS